MASALNECNGVTDGDIWLHGEVKPEVSIMNLCFLQASNYLSISDGSGILSIELPSLTSVGNDFQSPVKRM